jgi:hypothetical protein
MGFSVDKCLKINKSLGTIYLSTEPCLIKVINTAPCNNVRANETVIETTKASKVTAVVVVMSIFLKIGAICGALIPGPRSFIAKRWKVPISWRKIPADQKTFL